LAAIKAVFPVVLTVAAMDIVAKTKARHITNAEKKGFRRARHQTKIIGEAITPILNGITHIYTVQTVL
jgi:hypothetical protein